MDRRELQFAPENRQFLFGEVRVGGLEQRARADLLAHRVSGKPERERSKKPLRETRAVCVHARIEHALHRARRCGARRKRKSPTRLDGGVPIQQGENLADVERQGGEA